MYEFHSLPGNYPSLTTSSPLKNGQYLEAADKNGDLATSGSEQDDCLLAPPRSKRPRLSYQLHSQSEAEGKENQQQQQQPQQVVTKEKLRYLRYFRLVTHRKRNGNYTN